MAAPIKEKPVYKYIYKGKKGIPADPQTNFINDGRMRKEFAKGLGISGTVKDRKWKFVGKWYKPWTWRKKVFFVKKFHLESVSIVKDPPDKHCRIEW